jgi:hypothetical protein
MTTHSQRSLQARAAVHSSWAKTPDRSLRTAPARAALMAKFEREVDPDGTLPSAERALRAESRRKAHFLELARRSALARSARRSAGSGPH